MKIITDPVKLAKKLVSISSESGNEKEVAEFIFKYLKTLGLAVQKQKIEKNRFNVVVIGEGEILLNSHIDTVPIGEKKDWSVNPYGQIKNGRLYGRGSCDTKGNGACILAALAKNPTKKISCSFTVGEENTFAGIKEVMKMRRTKLKHIKYCLNFEPTELRLVTAHKGQQYLMIKAKGKAAHASTPEEGENAIQKLNHSINKLQKYIKTFIKKKHKLLGNPTLNIGVIKGGIGYNVIPDSAEIEIDIRTLPNQDSSKIIKQIKKVVAPSKVEVRHTHNPVDLPSKTPFIKLLQDILKNEGLKHQSRGVNYTTEFSEIYKYRIRGAVLGAGSVKQAHIIDEYVSVKDLKKLHKMLCALLELA
ncbi:M20 family metallopeptidase [Patescibacteria group bacterium]